MASVAGAHAPRVARARDLQTVRGRKEHGRYVFEGPTLLDEAARSGVAIEEIFATHAVYERSSAVRALEEGGTDVYLVDDRIAAKISDLDTPTGLLAVAEQRLVTLDRLLAARALVLADVNDPGNAGTLLRSAEAFGVDGVVFGSLGVDPYHPKVVRGSMGAIFRMPLAVASAQEFGVASRAAGAAVFGLDSAGVDLRAAPLQGPCCIVVGNERRGLGPWDACCTSRIAIPMNGPTESLNAAIAGSIALYEAARRSQAD